jgi:hypothetical protein
MTASRTTIFRGNEDEDDKKRKKLDKTAIAITIALGALLAAKLYFLLFWSQWVKNDNNFIQANS